jgi:hypothetical protein
MSVGPPRSTIMISKLEPSATGLPEQDGLRNALARVRKAHHSSAPAAATGLDGGATIAGVPLVRVRAQAGSVPAPGGATCRPLPPGQTEIDPSRGPRRVASVLPLRLESPRGCKTFRACGRGSLLAARLPKRAPPGARGSGRARPRRVRPSRADRGPATSTRAESSMGRAGSRVV